MYCQNESLTFWYSIRRIMGSLCLIVIISCLPATALNRSPTSGTGKSLAIRPRCGLHFVNRQFCSKTCSRVTEKCEQDCLHSVCDRTTDTHLKGVTKVQCIANCFETDKHQTRAGSKTHIEVNSDFKDTISTQDRAVWKQEMTDLGIDSDTLQKLCRTDAFRDAKVCQHTTDFEQITNQKAIETQNKSEKNANVVRRLLQVKSSSDRSKRSTRILSRFVRSTASRRRICEASTTLKNLSAAFHERSNTTVPLLTKEKARSYGFTNNFTAKQYEQQFQVATCGFKFPFDKDSIQVNNSRFKNAPICKPVKTRHLADIVIDPRYIDIKLFQMVSPCWKVSDKIAICRDWVVIESSCALFAIKK